MVEQEAREAREEHDEAQAIEGYGCICGFKTLNGEEVRTHVMLEAAHDGKGTHKSLGRINMQTGEVIMPPWNESTNGKHERKHERKARTKKHGGHMCFAENNRRIG